MTPAIAPEADEYRPVVSEYHREGRGCFDSSGVEQEPGDHDTSDSLAHVQQKHNCRGGDACGPEHVGHPDLAAAIFAYIDLGNELPGKQTEWN